MRPINIPEIVALLSILVTVIPIGYYLYNRKRITHGYALHLINGILIVSFLSDCAGYVFSSYRINTSLLYNIQDVLQFSLLSYFYLRVLYKKEDKISPVFLWGSAIYLIALVEVSLFFQKPWEVHQNYMWTASAGILLVYSVNYYLHLLATIAYRKEVLKLEGMLLVNGGILYYFCLTIFLFLTIEMIVVQFDAHVSRTIWSFNNVNNIIKNIFILMGFVKYVRSERNSAT